MCGFVGYAGQQAPFGNSRLKHMRDVLTHRGPDDAGLWTESETVAVGLGHRRLSILDTRKLGRQPMTTADGQVTIAYNGEFYGYKEQRARLQEKGFRFKSRTDTEVILALYQEMGIECLQVVDGMFGFAIWDRASNRLLLARDRLGIKPVFYAQLANGTLIFASEIKAILASGLIDDAIDMQAHHDYLALNYVPGERTMIKGIKRLQPGHFLTWQDGRIRIERYWHQTFNTELEQPRSKGYRDTVPQVLAAFDRAVERRLVSDVPLGMFLSGGIDSSAILTSMSRLHSGPVKAFTIAFEEASYDESEFAKRAAKAVGAEHHVEVVQPNPDVFLPALAESMDEPYADSSMIPLWYLCRLARQHVTVALGGDGGDELFAGYRTHFAWQLSRMWRKLPKPIRTTWANRVVNALPTSHDKVSFDLKARAFIRSASRTAIDAHYGFKEFMTEEARESLRHSSAEIEQTVRLFRDAVAGMRKPGSLDAILHADFEIYLPNDILVKVDKMSMLHSLEARVPFLDHELVEFSARLPASYKLRGFKTKAILKEAMRSRIPKELLKRRKAGFNVPMAQWLMGPLNPLMNDLLSESSVKRIGIWNSAEVKKLIEQHMSKQADHSRTLWAMICFMLFNQAYRQGRPA